MDGPVMRRVSVAADGTVAVDSVPRERPGPGEVLVRTALVGVCGSDLHAQRDEHPFIQLPYSPGHEAVGVIEALGAGANTFAAGERVLLEPNLVCGQCRRCTEGRYNICERLRVYGCQTAGAMADAFVIAADRLHRVPDGLSDLGAVLVEPLSTAMHAVRLAGDLEQADVVVLGAGPIGLSTALAAREGGARTVVVTDFVAEKRERALRFGATHALPADDADLPGRVRELAGAGADVVFDCVSVQSSVDQAVRTVAKGGTVMIVGVPSGSVPVPLDLVQDREITVLGSLMYTGEDVRRSIEVLTARGEAAEELVSAEFPLERAAEAFAAAGGAAQRKVVVRP